jgi:hypothetical protein
MLPRRLTERDLTVLRKVEAADLSCVESKLLQDKRMSPSEVRSALLEFKRFMALVALGIKPLAMIGPRVDEVWHQFILFTKQYRAFCAQTLGRFVNHQPNTQKTPVPSVAWQNFIRGYREHFGDLPRIWYAGLDRASMDYFNGRGASPPMRWSGWTGD